MKENVLKICSAVSWTNAWTFFKSTENTTDFCHLNFFVYFNAKVKVIFRPLRGERRERRGIP